MRAAYAVVQCLSVCLSVRLMSVMLCIVSKESRILKRFPPFGSDTILVFPYQTLCQY